MSEKKKDKYHRFTQKEINELPGQEMKSRRTRSSKTYSLGNGLYQSVIYPDAVHYRNERGEWEDIDHTLTQGNGALCDHSGELAMTLAPGGCVTLKKDNHSLSWQIRGANPVEAVPENANTNYPRHDKKIRTENKATYINIFPDVDLVCDLKPNQFKDTLVFKNSDALRPVEFLIRAENLVLHQSASGAVVAMCGDDLVFRLPKPCVMDEHGATISDSANAVLKKISECEWSWTCEVSSDYAALASYPIRLDPGVETEVTGADLVLAYTSSKQPTANFPASGYYTLIANNDYTYGKTRTFLQVEQDDLPKIDSSYYITAATLSMYTADPAPTKSTPVYLKEVEGPWTQSSITHNNQPSVSSKAVEHGIAPKVSGMRLAFNITNTVRKWYNGANYGIMLEATAGSTVRLCSVGATYHKPYMTITYVSLAGLESYLQQDSINCGRAGTAHVGLFNGNLVFSHQETSMNGNLMPVSIGRYYNSCYQDVNAFHVGKGWKLSTQQTLHKETIDSTVHYVYMDGDGTRHFFKQTDSEWKDLSGLQLTMEIADNIATISDKGGNKMNFPLPTNEFLVDGVETYGNVTWITSVEDACGTKAKFVHTKTAGETSNEFNIATDGASRATKASMNNAQMITYIKAPGMSPVQYEYNNAYQLTKITHPDNEITEYRYDSNGLLAAVINCDNSGINIIYLNGITSRVREIQMFDKNQQVYAIRKYEYGNCCTTVFDTYRHVDETTQAVTYGDGKKLHYHFNDAGNLVSVNDELGYGYFVGYSDDAPANHPAYTSKLQRAVTNYLKNHHFVTVNDDWTVAKSGGTGTCAYSSDNNYIGGRAYKFQKTNSTGYISIYQTVTLKDGADYTLSCQYQTLNSTQVQLQVENAVGGTIKESTPAKCTNRWNRTHVSFTVPKTTAEDVVTYTDVTIRIMAVGGPGTVWVDAAQLEDGLIPNRYNLLENGTFYMNSSGIPLYWSEGVEEENEDMDGVTTAIAEGRPSELTGNAVQLHGKAGVSKIIDQTVPCRGNAGDTFVAGGWSWSNCRPRDESNNCRYEMQVLAKPTNGTNQFVTVGRVQWSEEWSGWQFAATPIVIPWNYSNMYVKLVYQNNLNEAQFSNLFLHKEEFGKTFAYDENGNVTSVKNVASLQSGSEYDDFDNLISYHQPGRNEEYTLDWGSSDADKKLHLLRKTTSPLNIVQRTIYDTRTATTENPSTTLGLPEKTYTEATFVNDEGVTCHRFIAAETEYTEDKNYVSKTTDARKKEVTTTTDTNRGVVTSVKDPKNQTVSYKYDDLNRVKMVYTADGDKAYLNQYVYVDDLLKEIRHNTTGNAITDWESTESVTRADDVVYTFEYDDKNRRTGVKVGNQYLSSNKYNDTAGPQYGVLARTIFGDPEEPCQVINYTYDDFRRLKSMQYGSDASKKFSYEYGANGQVARVTNHELNRVVLSEYDISNRPMRITHLEGNTHVYTGEVTYDNHNNLARFEESVGSDRASYSTSFEYDEENKPERLKYNDSDSDKVEYTYDELGRIAKQTVTVDGHASETNYTYLAGAQTYTPEDANDAKPAYSTTGLIEHITQAGGNFTYTYDDNGNIIRVVQNGVTTSYTYDALGQLIRVDDGHENATWVYTYDQGGNILSKKRYAYTTSSIANTTTPLETMSFSYTNANWKDQLTAVNGKPITYDNIGNPTQYGANTDSDKITFEWEKGRQLKKMVKTGEIVEFKYNENGLRTQKVATSTGTTNYTLHGKNIVHMTQGSNNLHFFYDASNKPAIVEYNGTKYAYVHNLQGDIVAILDSNGTAVVQYKYDAWGKPISKTGSMKDSLGTLNPFRYRGYVYDEETGLYYLRTRYFDSVQNRFLSSDSRLTLNLYTYCSNNPVIRCDASGMESKGYLKGDQFHTVRTLTRMKLFASPTFVDQGASNYVASVKADRLLTIFCVEQDGNGRPYGIVYFGDTQDVCYISVSTQFYEVLSSNGEAEYWYGSEDMDVDVTMSRSIQVENIQLFCSQFRDATGQKIYDESPDGIYGPKTAEALKKILLSSEYGAQLSSYLGNYGGYLVVDDYVRYLMLQLQYQSGGDPDVWRNNPG